jgi:hypothetical protein
MAAACHRHADARVENYPGCLVARQYVGQTTATDSHGCCIDQMAGK